MSIAERAETGLFDQLHVTTRQRQSRQTSLT